MVLVYPTTYSSVASNFATPSIPSSAIPSPALNRYLVEVVTGPDPKKCISSFYNHLMLPAATAQAYKLKSWWETDVGDMTDKDWEECMPFVS